MIHIRNLQDMPILLSDPELWREVYGYLSVCVAEFLEVANQEDLSEQNFNFSIIEEADILTVKKLSTPEECVQIGILSTDDERHLFRVVYPTEVLFIPGEFVEHLPFAIPTLGPAPAPKGDKP